jgi:hypothetical protein
MVRKSGLARMPSSLSLRSAAHVEEAGAEAAAGEAEADAPAAGLGERLVVRPRDRVGLGFVWMGHGPGASMLLRRERAEDYAT